MIWSEDSPHRPFCSARCKGLDFGAWASESYRVAAVEDTDSPGDDQPG